MDELRVILQGGLWCTKIAVAYVQQAKLPNSENGPHCRPTPRHGRFSDITQLTMRMPESSMHDVLLISSKRVTTRANKQALLRKYFDLTNHQHRHPATNAVQKPWHHCRVVHAPCSPLK
jgi:hypothetical protein